MRAAQSARDRPRIERVIWVTADTLLGHLVTSIARKFAEIPSASDVHL